MIATSPSELVRLGQTFVQKLQQPKPSPKAPSSLASSVVIELIGDVGIGKTTFAQGLALGFGLTAPITSPSFTISKRYPLSNGGEFIHYDFYRLSDVGIMSSELAEAISQPRNVIVLEWANSVADFLPHQRFSVHFSLLDEDGSRQINILRNGKEFRL